MKTKKSILEFTNFKLTNLYVIKGGDGGPSEPTIGPKRPKNPDGTGTGTGSGTI